MRRSKLYVLAVLTAALSIGLGCATTQGGADATGPPAPSDDAQQVMVYVGAGLPVLEAGFKTGVTFAARQQQVPRCFVFLGLQTIAHWGSEWAPAVSETEEWLPYFPAITVDPSVCGTNLSPRTDPKTAEVVQDVIGSVASGLEAITDGVLKLANVPCRWRSWAIGIERELVALGITIVGALAHPNEPWTLPRVELPTCPGATTAPPAPPGPDVSEAPPAAPLPHPAAVGG